MNPSLACSASTGAVAPSNLPSCPPTSPSYMWIGAGILAMILLPGLTKVLGIAPVFYGWLQATDQTHQCVNGTWTCQPEIWSL